MQIDLQLDKNYGSFSIDVHGDYKLRGVTALFGPSGAGKTTVLETIAGFRPHGGRVVCDGQVWQDEQHSVPAHRRPVSLIFQNARLFGHLNVEGNLRYADQRAPSSGPAISYREVIDVFELSELLGRAIGGLSGGETQRVAIARALLARPKLLLMDEPLNALDRERKANILGLIRLLPERFDLPVIYVSHQVEEIVSLSDQLIAMSAGRVIGSGPTTEMLADLGPEVTGHFEAGSILVGEVVEHDWDYQMTYLAVAGERLAVPGAMNAEIGEIVRLRLRARDVSIGMHRVDEVTIRNQIRATIEQIRPESGAHAEIKLRCADDQLIIARVTRKAVKDLGLIEGLQVFTLIKAVAFDRRLQ
ncbi:MAG: molybdenum ABC transporter ATP-binding protein [Pseudomonadota bacterium]